MKSKTTNTGVAQGDENSPPCTPRRIAPVFPYLIVFPDEYIDSLNDFFSLLSTPPATYPITYGTADNEHEVTEVIKPASKAKTSDV